MQLTTLQGGLRVTPCHLETRLAKVSQPGPTILAKLCQPGQIIEKSSNSLVLPLRIRLWGSRRLLSTSFESKSLASLLQFHLFCFVFCLHSLIFSQFHSFYIHSVSNENSFNHSVPFTPEVSQLSTISPFFTFKTQTYSFHFLQCLLVSFSADRGCDLLLLSLRLL